MFKIPKIKPINKNHWQKIQRKIDNLIKPVGSLARLEYITCLYASSQMLEDVVYPKKELIVCAKGEFNPKKLQAMDESVCIRVFHAKNKDCMAAFEDGKNSVSKGAEPKIIGIAFFGEQLDDAQKVLATIEQDDIIKLDHCKNAAELFFLAGVIMQAANFNLPVFLDGEMMLIAAAMAVKLQPITKDYLICVSTTTSSLESILIDKLDLFTMLDLKIQNPSGQAVMLGFSLLDAGVKALREMDSFGDQTVHGPLGDIKKKD